MSEPLSCWRFHAVDSWFFRETRAHDAVGVGELSSVFPPPARTLLGAIRTWLGDRLEVDWHRFAEGRAKPAHHTLLGDADQPGQLSLAAVILRHRGETLWPCPADLMIGEHNGKSIITRLRPGNAVYCDLGRVALPTVVSGAPAGSKVLENAWLTPAGATKWLEGGIPARDQVIFLDELIEEESRLGIGRDNRRATIQQGLLYQTRHIRFRDASTCVEVWLRGVPQTVVDDASARQTLRLGGEGRMAEVAVSRQSSLPFPKVKGGVGSKLALWLNSPMLLAEADADSGLPGFVPTTTREGLDVWEGELKGIALRLVSSCRPRAYREGGWDQRRRQPRAVRSYLAPGSVLFCELRDDTPIEEAARHLHGCQIGADTAWGKGGMFAAAIDW